MPEFMKRTVFLLMLIHVFLFSAQADEFYRDEVKEVVIDTKRNLMWQDDISARGTDKSYEDAKAHCENLDFASYKDWYLPNLDELKSIIKAENYPRSILKVFNNVYSDYYWSSSEYTAEYAWLVLFIYEDVVYYHKRDTNFVRCVRKGK